MSDAQPTRGELSVLLVCPGLDHAQRGFESFARECFDALREEDGLDIELVKGSGPAAPGERAIPTLRRDLAPTRLLGRLMRRPPFVIEHLAFAAAGLPLLRRRRPDVIYFSEWHVGRVLALWRRWTRQRFRLVLCNGTLWPGPYDHLDLVQQLTPAALDYVLARGESPEKNVQLPLGFRIDQCFTPLEDNDLRALRQRLGLPVDRRIVLSVAALNRYHKRLDYLIEEVARMPDSRPYLVLAGEQEPETASVRRLAESRLGPDGYSIRSVPRKEVDDLYSASDVFALASLWEGLPRALIEAMDHGLPCVTHDYAIAEYALGPHRRTGNFDNPGELARALGAIADAELEPAQSAERHRFVYERFSWEVLRPRYVELLRSAVN